MPRTKAFTLVEILVVLTVIALLSALLLGVVIRVRGSAQRTTCSSNLQQLYKGIQMYLQDNESRFPHLRSWTNDVEPYLKEKAVFICPTAKTVGIQGTTYSFEFNRLNDKSINSQGVHLWLGKPESALSSFAHIFLLIDGVGEDLNGVSLGSSEFLRYNDACHSRTSFVAREFATYHLGGGNHLFLDGHVKWLTPAAALDIDCSPHPA